LFLQVLAVLSRDAPKVEVDMYLTSKSPDAAQYIYYFQESVLGYTGLPDIIQLTMNYIAVVDASQPSGFDSRHGQTEVWGDITELCVMNLVPENYTWWDFVFCMSTDYSDIPDNSQHCAEKVGVSVHSVTSCIQTHLGKNLMLRSINITDSLNWNPRPTSPTVYINGVCEYGWNPCNQLDPRGHEVRDYICNQYTGTPPDGCNWNKQKVIAK